MKTPKFTLKKIAFLVLSLVCLFGVVAGVFWQGMKVGGHYSGWQVNTDTGVLLIHALKQNDEGNDEEFIQSLEQLLYLSALGTDQFKDNLLVTEGGREASERYLQAVADYYWKHPDSFNLEWDMSEESSETVSAMALEGFMDMMKQRQRQIAEILISRKPAGTNSTISPDTE